MKRDRGWIFDTAMVVALLGAAGLLYHGLGKVEGRVDELGKRFGDVQAASTALRGTLDSFKQVTDSVRIDHTKYLGRLDTITIRLDSSVQQLRTAVQQLRTLEGGLDERFSTLREEHKEILSALERQRGEER